MPRVLAFIEALGLTGAARNLLESGTHADLHVATYRRRTASRAHHMGVDALVTAVERWSVPITVIEERHAFDPTVIARVRQTIDRIQPDIVQTHNIKSHALVARVHAACGRPWLAFHHGYTDVDFKDRLYRRIDRLALRSADMVVTPCAAFAHDLTEVGVDPRRIVVVHNAVSPRTLPPRADARHALGLEGARVVLSVGRLSREKGHDVLVDACATLDPSVRRDVIVVIAGEGPERRRLEARAAAAGVTLRCDGFQADVAPYYAAADLFVLPSRSEGSPNALLEALAAGCPIVASRVGGVPEIVQHGVSARLVVPDRPLQLREAIEHVLRRREVAADLAASGRIVAARFTPARRAAALGAIYASVLGRRAAAAGARP